jgi:hypothetical protein
MQISTNLKAVRESCIVESQTHTVSTTPGGVRSNTATPAPHHHITNLSHPPTTLQLRSNTTPIWNPPPPCNHLNISNHHHHHTIETHHHRTTPKVLKISESAPTTVIQNWPTMEALGDARKQPTTSKSEPENYTSAGVARKATPRRNNIEVERKTT